MKSILRVILVVASEKKRLYWQPQWSQSHALVEGRNQLQTSLHILHRGSIHVCTVVAPHHRALVHLVAAMLLTEIGISNGTVESHLGCRHNAPDIQCTLDIHILHSTAAEED